MTYSYPSSYLFCYLNFISNLTTLRSFVQVSSIYIAWCQIHFFVQTCNIHLYPFIMISSCNIRHYPCIFCYWPMYLLIHRPFTTSWLSSIGRQLMILTRGTTTTFYTSLRFSTTRFIKCMETWILTIDSLYWRSRMCSEIVIINTILLLFFSSFTKFNFCF